MGPLNITCLFSDFPNTFFLFYFHHFLLFVFKPFDFLSMSYTKLCLRANVQYKCTKSLSSYVNTSGDYENSAACWFFLAGQLPCKMPTFLKPLYIKATINRPYCFQPHASPVPPPSTSYNLLVVLLWYTVSYSLASTVSHKELLYTTCHRGPQTVRQLTWNKDMAHYVNLWP